MKHLKLFEEFKNGELDQNELNRLVDEFKKHLSKNDEKGTLWEVEYTTADDEEYDDDNNPPIKANSAIEALIRVVLDRHYWQGVPKTLPYVPEIWNGILVWDGQLGATWKKREDSWYYREDSDDFGHTFSAQIKKIK